MADKPVTIDEKKLFTLPGAILISIVMLAGTVGIGWSKLRSQVDEIPALRARVDDHDRSLAKIDVIANDITWIKQELVRRNQMDTRRTTASP